MRQNPRSGLGLAIAKAIADNTTRDRDFHGDSGTSVEFVFEFLSRKVNDEEINLFYHNHLRQVCCWRS